MINIVQVLYAPQAVPLLTFVQGPLYIYFSFGKNNNLFIIVFLVLRNAGHYNPPCLWGSHLRALHANYVEGPGLANTCLPRLGA